MPRLSPRTAAYIAAAAVALSLSYDLMRAPAQISDSLGPLLNVQESPSVFATFTATAAVWTFRSAGVHHMIRVQAFKQQNDWARVPRERLRDEGSPEDRRAAALVRQLRHDALEMRVTNAHLLPRWADRLVGRMTTGRWAAIALAAPGCLLAAGLSLTLVQAAFGHHPMWPDQQLKLSEAAGFRDEAEVLRLTERGEDPNLQREVRAGLLFDLAVRLTPLEVAVASRDPQMVRQLLGNDAVVDAHGWNRLRCLSEDNESSLLLDQHRPLGVTMRCDDVRPPWRPDDDE